MKNDILVTVAAINKDLKKKSDVAGEVRGYLLGIIAATLCKERAEPYYDFGREEIAVVDKHIRAGFFVSGFRIARALIEGEMAWEDIRSSVVKKALKLCEQRFEDNYRYIGQHSKDAELREEDSSGLLSQKLDGPAEADAVFGGEEEWLYTSPSDVLCEERPPESESVEVCPFHQQRDAADSRAGEVAQHVVSEDDFLLEQLMQAEEKRVAQKNKLGVALQKYKKLEQKADEMRAQLLEELRSQGGTRGGVYPFFQQRGTADSRAREVEQHVASEGELLEQLMQAEEKRVAQKNKLGVVLQKYKELEKQAGEIRAQLLEELRSQEDTRAGMSP